MTALPLQRPQLLTAAEFAALPEVTDGRYELQEGRVVMSPSPVPEHQLCRHRLQVQLDPQVPAGLCLLPAVDVDLGLVPPTMPGFVRNPDIVVVTFSGFERHNRDGGLLRADEIVLAVEIMSDGSRRTDRTIKHDEYADAGIPHYWIIDFDSRPALTACHLAGESGYIDAAPVSGTFTADEPFPVRLDLDRLG
jgi:Uma2 family endonuclease